MDKKQDYKFNVIDVDEKCGDAKIIEVSEEDYNARIASGDSSSMPVITEENKDIIGKQIVMNRIIGFDDSENISRRQLAFKKITSGIFIALVVAVLIWTAYNDFFATGATLPPKEYIVGILNSNWFYIIFALVALFGCYLFKALKLSAIAKSLTGKWHLKTSMETAILGLYYNYVTPLAVGGQPFEIYHMSKNGISGGTASSMSLSTFILHQLAFVILSIVSIVLYINNRLNIPQPMLNGIPSVIKVLAIIGVFCCMFMPIVVIVFSLNSKFGNRLVNFVFKIGAKLKLFKDPEQTKKKTLENLNNNAMCLKQLATRPVVFSFNVLCSFLEQLSLASTAYFSLKFFGFDWPAHGFVEWLQVIELCFILNSAISFIPTPGNSGAADLSFYLLFNTGLGISATIDSSYGGVAFCSMLVWRLLSFYSFIVVGFIFSRCDKKRTAKKKKQQN